MGCGEVACMAAGLVLCTHDSSMAVLNITGMDGVMVVHSKWSLSHTSLARQPAASAYLPQEVGGIAKLGSCSCLVSTLRKNAAGLDSIYESYRAHSSILAHLAAREEIQARCAERLSRLGYPVNLQDQVGVDRPNYN